jgi:hypothetical protein
MLGWRHDASGSCQAWVRVEFAGVVEDAWVDLALLRLPEARADRHLALARPPKGAAVGSRAHVLDDEAPRSAEVTQTQHLPLVREASAPAGGRRVPPTGGRRRAPETAEQPAGPAAPPVVDSPSLGRHRAPAAPDAGRHRAADTGLLTAVRADAVPVPGPGGSADRWGPPPSRSELPPAGPPARPAPRRGQVEPDLLTRPMRLEEGVGSVRRSRRDSLTGV